mmetsp:Transcript_37386/g.55790  ORF Transcript_37386/g.55790 Transcript_37386/m.55790 type:complete len:177 (-) Transcript_37386:31-561(-)
MVDGSVLKLTRKAQRFRWKISGETWLRVWLEDQQVDVAYFTPVATILCCEAGPSCNHETGLRPFFSHTLEPIACYKYKSEEMEVARAVTDEFESGHMRRVLRSEAQGWLWVHRKCPANQRKRGPDFGEATQTFTLECCLSQSGPVSCWSWIFWRRCKSIASPVRIGAEHRSMWIAA